MKNNIKKLLLIFIALPTFLIAQNFNPKTVSLSDTIDKIDFSFLKEELKEVQVVLLGEKTHYEGNVFEMKTKIIKYLYEEMGFKTIAFESGIYDVWKAQENINKGENTTQVFQNSLFSIWSKREEFQSFIQFYEVNRKELKLYGFDNQITGVYGQNDLVNDLYKYAKSINFKVKLNQEDFKLLLESMLKSNVFDDEDISYEQYESTLSQLFEKSNSQPKNETNFYWSQIIESLLELGESYMDSEVIISTFNTTKADNIRDKQMANNLLAYLKANPNEKVICWGANQHFVNDMSSISTAIVKEYVPMGSYIKKALKEKIYSLALITAEDSIYLQNKWNDTPVKTNSFEEYLKKSKVSHLFVSSNQSEMKKPKLNRLFSPITFIEARLDLLHDGYLYLDKAITATLISTNEEFKAINKHKIIIFDEEEEKQTQLNEVIVYGKRTPYQIMKKVIDNLENNYTDSAFSSILYSNVKTTIQDSLGLDLDFIANQYDYGYINHDFRSLKKIKEIQWNLKEGFEPKSIREFYGLVYNSPIQYTNFLKSRKYKKYDFTLEETRMYNKEEVYVISFSSPRDHSNFTGRVYTSNYSGYLYINKSDFAVVKLFENWQVKDFPEQFKLAHSYSGNYEKYTNNKYTNESTATYFNKINKKYYITNCENTISGEISDEKSNFLTFDTKIVSCWNSINTINPVKINNKEEEHLFAKVNYNEEFWKTYQFPNTKTINK